MTQQEINDGIALICNTSKVIQNCYESKQALVDEINNAKNEDIERCWQYYKDRFGVVVDVRKELFRLIKDGQIITVNLLDELVAKYKEGKENQFRVYKNFYTIFYPAITFYGHEPQRQFVREFTKKLILDLGLETHVKTTSFDFQGPRQQGSDRYWFAIYNIEQPNQSTSLQFFIEFWHGDIGYGIHRHSDNSYLKPRIVLDSESFVYDDMLDYFKSEVEILINDKPKYENLSTIDLQGNNLYKISHGTFKAKNKSHIIEAFKENNWIVLHENTGKDQSRYFKEDLHEGDYVYITLGSKELIGIAKIVSEDWDYVPFEIVDAEGWMYREVEFIQGPARKNPKDLKDTKNIFPSGNSTLTEIKNNVLEEANEKLFKPYFNAEFHNSEIVKMLDTSIREVDSPLNQILYGPPGTGKTYNTVLEAAKIVTGNINISYDEALNIFNDNLDTQIEFITFHQNYSYEDFIQGLRPDTENGNALTFEKKDGVFKRIADKALKNLEASKNPASVKKDFEIVFNELIVPLNLGDVSEVEIKMKKSSFFITEVGEKSISFRKNIGDSEHTLSINTLRKMYDKGFNDIILGGLQPYYNPILELLLEKGKSTETVVPRKNYVIIIDEINRANISRVFGELITLIEEDKRSDGAIPMRVTLPSGDKFIVPSNLYIIGTMNTADKSIALLDIALRRRFEFVPMYPEVSKVKQEYQGLFEKMNKTIKEKKNHDFTIGHAYFMDNSLSLEKIINNKVIPLLLEYFMNSEEQVTEIMTSAGVSIGGWPLKMIV